MKEKETKRGAYAQTIIELAVFGAIIIFVIGVIIRQAVGHHYQQNQALP